MTSPIRDLQPGNLLKASDINRIANATGGSVAGGDVTPNGIIIPEDTGGDIRTISYIADQNISAYSICIISGKTTDTTLENPLVRAIPADGDNGVMFHSGYVDVEAGHTGSGFTIGEAPILIESDDIDTWAGMTGITQGGKIVEGQGCFTLAGIANHNVGTGNGGRNWYLYRTAQGTPEIKYKVKLQEVLFLRTLDENTLPSPVPNDIGADAVLLQTSFQAVRALSQFDLYRSAPGDDTSAPDLPHIDNPLYYPPDFVLDAVQIGMTAGDSETDPVVPPVPVYLCYQPAEIVWDAIVESAGDAGFYNVQLLPTDMFPNLMTAKAMLGKTYSEGTQIIVKYPDTNNMALRIISPLC